MNEQYRKSVGLVLVNRENLLFWGRRFPQQQQNWQFPQGGIERGERAEAALYRELREETGLQASDVELLGQSRGWHSYQIPPEMRDKSKFPSSMIGQRQRWFLLRLTSDDNQIDLNVSEAPEFSDWRWIHAGEAVKEIVYFKRALYRNVIEEFSSVVDFAGLAEAGRNGASRLVDCEEDNEDEKDQRDLVEDL